MAWRTFAIFLLAMNLAAFAYAWFSPLESAQPLQATDARTPGLILLSERDRAQMKLAAQTQAQAAASNDVEEAVSPDTIVDANTDTSAQVTDSANLLTAEFCERIGPIANLADATSFRARLGAIVAQAELAEEQVTQVRGLWVYLGGMKDRESSLARARQLSAAGIRDYYVVTEGDSENRISLGMFRDAANADKRIAQVAALGFKAERLERGESVTQYWVQYRAATQSKSQIAAMRGIASLKRETMFCTDLGGQG
jgi:SPOR domain